MTESSVKKESKFGFVAIIGRPNVGKSTLMNRMIGHKISITSHRPQTTRHRILGILTEANYQIAFVDTPGIHSVDKKSNKKQINKLINKTAISSIEGVDAILLMMTAKGWTEQDKKVLSALKGSSAPVILLINKVDVLDNKESLLPLIEASRQQYDFHEIMPICALKKGKNDNVALLTEQLVSLLPNEPIGFEEDQLTDRSYRFLVSEFVREQLFRRLGDELPYATAVEITQFTQKKGKTYISADIWVDKKSHKAMVIGKEGSALKAIGTQARKNCETLLQTRVFIELWVKVRTGWADNARDLYSLGYDEGA